MERRKATRQACDLCYNKRIKCDSKKPRCAHCVVYDVECTYAAASRKVAPRKQSARKKEKEDAEALQSRVDRLEAHLKFLSDKVDRLENLAPQDAAAHHASVAASDDNHYHEAMNLPPLEEVLPAIERYLATFNSILPLFHPKTLLHTVKQWYWHPRQRDQTTWAAINVALALAHRQSDGNESIQNTTIAEFLDNAQSVLTQVIMSDTDLINVQVLVGLVMLFQGTQNLRPPMVLIATALRLAHKLGLHTRTSSVNLDHSEALQRDRVFWIAYILDKDISMRTTQPPVQLDADIDLHLPPKEPDGEDDLGFFFTADGRSKINFFRSRVELARIQGSVYDSLYSARSQNHSPEQRAQNIVQIRGMLADWTCHIPDGFSARTLSQAGPTTLSRFFCILYSTQLSCLALISKATSWDTKWVQDLQDYGRKTVAGETVSPVFLPQDWQTLVTTSRDLMRLFMSVPKKDPAFVWMTACTYISGLVCLAANSMHNPSHEALELDRDLMDDALQFVDEMVLQTNMDSLRNVRDACRELQQHVLVIAHNERRSEAGSHLSGDAAALNPNLREDLSALSYAL